MPMDVSATPGEGIVPEAARDAARQPAQRASEAALPLEHPTVPEHQPHQGHQLRRRPIAVHEGLAQADVAAGERTQEEPLVVDRQGCIQLARLPVSVRAVGALHGQRSAGHAAEAGEKRRLRPLRHHAHRSITESVRPAVSAA